jgi:hypothetical protein
MSGIAWRVRSDLQIVAGLFIASTALYALLGVRFDDRAVGMHFIDTQLLTDRLLESLWFYHGSPPMLNLLTGIGLKLFGGHAAGFFSVVFHVLGFVVALCIHAITLQLSKSRVTAVVTTALVVFSPSFVLYENVLFYDFLALALLTFVTFALCRYLQTLSTAWCHAFFVLAGTLLLTRSMFHLAWMLVVAGALVAVAWQHRRQILLAAAVPLLVVTLWYGKNYYYFGTFGASTWVGLGLSNITTLLVPKRELAPLIQEGKLSEWALVSRYRDDQILFMTNQRPPTGIPVLDQVKKSSGEYNLNFRDIPVVDRYYTADALTVIREFPSLYVLGLVMANRQYFSPTDMNDFFTPGNKAAVRPMQVILDPLLAGTSPRTAFMEQPHFGFTGRYTIPVNTSVPLIFAWLLVFSYGYWYARKGILSGETQARPDAVVIGFVVLTAAYLYAVSTAIEFSENFRYRVVVEPLFFALAATAVTRLIRSLGQRFARAQLAAQ